MFYSAVWFIIDFFDVIEERGAEQLAEAWYEMYFWSYYRVVGVCWDMGGYNSLVFGLVYCLWDFWTIVLHVNGLFSTILSIYCLINFKVSVAFYFFDFSVENKSF